MTLRRGIITACLLACTSLAQSQHSLGTTGLLNIPTADMQETGTFRAGVNYLPQGMTPFQFNTGNYFLNLTFLSMLELSYRCTLLKSTRYDGKRGYFQQDRSMSARIRPLKEKRYLPAVVIGTNDPFRDTGINYFATVYAVLTKGFTIAQGDCLTLTAGYYQPLNNHSVQKGVFGGMSYSPAFCRQVTLMSEYDAQGFNLGASAKLWKHLSLHLFTREFNCLSAGVHYECQLLH